MAFAVIAADAIMSFFGSMGNDIGFNAWINDHMTPENSGSLGADLAVQPVIGTIAGTVAGGLLVGADDNYMRLFIVIGGSVIALGLVSLVGIKDAESLRPSIKGSFSEQFFSIFNIKEYIVFICNKITCYAAYCASIIIWYAVQHYPYHGDC